MQIYFISLGQNNDGEIEYFIPPMSRTFVNFFKNKIRNNVHELTMSNRSRQLISLGRNLLKECRIILSV